MGSTSKAPYRAPCIIGESCWGQMVHALMVYRLKGRPLLSVLLVTGNILSKRCRAVKQRALCSKDANTLSILSVPIKVTKHDFRVSAFIYISVMIYYPSLWKAQSPVKENAVRLSVFLLSITIPQPSPCVYYCHHSGGGPLTPRTCLF